MAEIQTLLKNISNAVLGKDVRQSIHDAIQQCYYDGKAGAVDLEARQMLESKADKTDISTPYNFKGNCLFGELPVEGNAVNDTYYCTDAKCKYTWNGEAWYQSSLNEEEYADELAQLSGSMNESVSQLSGEIADVHNVLGIKENFVIDNLQYGQSMVNSSMRWFINYLFPKNSYIKEMDFYGRAESGQVNIEFWECVGDEVRLRETKTTTINQGINNLAVNFSANYNYMIAICTNTFGMTITNSTAILGLLAADDKTSTSLNMSSFISYPNLDICGSIVYLSRNPESNKGNIVTIGENCDYEEIQNALDAIEDDTIDNPYTLVVYPKATAYKRFSLIRKLSEDYPNTVSKIRNISIIGIDKYHTVVQDDTGDYWTPPCEALTNGTISNIRFIATHDNENVNAERGSYACHIDTNYPSIGYSMIFDNCDFISNQAPGVGIGLNLNSNLVFKNCYFENKGSVSYKPNENYINLASYGSVFCHSDTSANVANQNITFDNCRGISINGDSLKLTATGNYNGGMTVKAYNSMFYSKNGNKVSKSTNIELDVTSYGNNSAVLNA